MSHVLVITTEETINTFMTRYVKVIAKIQRNSVFFEIKNIDKKQTSTSINENALLQTGKFIIIPLVN